MKEKLELIRGTGNVYRDLGEQDADSKQFKAIRDQHIRHLLGEFIGDERILRDVFIATPGRHDGKPRDACVDERRWSGRI